MELSNLLTVADHEAGAECRLFSPKDGSITDTYILLAGVDSAVWRKAKRRQTSEIMAATRSKEPVDLDYDAMDVTALVDATISWRGITSQGNPYEFTKENALALYSGSPDVVKQLLDFIADKRNFTKGWSKSLSGSGDGVFTSTPIQKAPRSAGTKRLSKSRKV
jgi:hypothetical protein